MRKFIATNPATSPINYEIKPCDWYDGWFHQPGVHLKLAYWLLNIRAFEISPLYKVCVVHSMGKIVCVKFQRGPLKFHTKYLAHTLRYIPDSEVHGANIGPTWVLSAPAGPHVDPMNLAIRDDFIQLWHFKSYSVMACAYAKNVVIWLPGIRSMHRFSF